MYTISSVIFLYRMTSNKLVLQQHTLQMQLLWLLLRSFTLLDQPLSSILVHLHLSAAFTISDTRFSCLSPWVCISGAAWCWLATCRDNHMRWHCFSTGVPVADPFLFIYSPCEVISSHGFLIPHYANDILLVFFVLPLDPQVSEQISACLEEVLSWMVAYYLKLNFRKAELLYIPGQASLAC